MLYVSQVKSPNNSVNDCRKFQGHLAYSSLNPDTTWTEQFEYYSKNLIVFYFFFAKHTKVRVNRPSLGHSITLIKKGKDNDDRVVDADVDKGGMEEKLRVCCAGFVLV